MGEKSPKDRDKQKKQHDKHKEHQSKHQKHDEKTKTIQPEQNKTNTAETNSQTYKKAG